MSRKICIDGHNLSLQHGTGVATYARNLANNITELGQEAWTLYGAPTSGNPPNVLNEVLFFDYLGGAMPKKPRLNELMQYAKDAVKAPFGVKATKLVISGTIESRRFSQRLPHSSEIINSPNLFNIARAYFKRHNRFLTVNFDDPPDVMHWTYPLPLKVNGIRNIYTIHDLVPLRLPYTTLDNKRYYFKLIKKCIESGTICTVSERSKHDIEGMFALERDSVYNTYQSVDDVNSSDEDVDSFASVKGVYDLEPQSYFLFLGAIEPKKNVGRLIEAFLSVQSKTKLILAGSAAWKSDEELKLYHSIISQNPRLKSKVKLLGYVPQPFLVKLIRSARAVVFPSLYEGFGLPILEAMQLGTPTLCSREGSLPEIAGSASVFVDAYSVESIATGMRALDSSAALRQQLSIDGVAQARKFSKDEYKKRLTELYQL